VTTESRADLTRTADRLNGPGARALAALSDRDILDAWEATVAAFLDPESPERRRLGDELARATRLSPEGLEAGLAAVLGGVRGEPARALFEEATRLRGDRAPDGMALVILASNLPALAVQPLLPALAARRPVLLKCPSAEPLFTPAFVRALAGRSPTLGEAVATAVWPGGDAEREAPLLARAGVVLAYGDREAVESLERRAREAGSTGGGARFVAYGPRTSLAVVGPEADPEEVAPGLARDVALFDQRGCLSVAAVYVEGGEERARGVAPHLARALAEALRELAGRWPPGPATPESAAAVRQLRELAGMRGLDLFEVGDTLAEGTVLVEPEPAFQPTPGLRTVRVHPLPDLARLPEILAAWQEGRDRLQGVALAGVPKEKAGTLVPALTHLGVSRIAAPGELQHPDTAWHNGGVNPLEVLIPGVTPSGSAGS
jgi:hypothetical protein